MKKIIILILILFSFITKIFSQIEYGGEFNFSKAWYMFHKKWQMSRDTYHLFDFYIENNIEDKVKFKARIQIRMWDEILIQTPSDLSDSNKILNFEILPWEFWITINDILINNLNLKLGKQYFEWGTADGIHPTSVINPDDYTNPFSMSEKIPVNAIYLSYVILNLKLELIWLPYFLPAKMPKHFPLFNYSENIMPMTIVKEITEKIDTPKIQPEGIGKGAKISFELLNINFSTGIFTGYDYFPYIKEITFIPLNLTEFSENILLKYPKMLVYTSDFTTSLFGFGLWGEIGVYDYDKLTTFITTPTATFHEIFIDGKPYASYILGTDYTFQNGFYFNLQYSFGLPYVRGREFLEDYFILSLKNDFFEGILETSFNTIYGFKRKYNALKTYELMLTPMFKILVYDDVEINLSITEIIANGNILFKDWEKYDLLNLMISYNF